MTDTGQIPGEGQPENTGAQPEAQPVSVPAQAPGTYTFAEHGDGGSGAGVGGAPAEEEDLLMPGTQGAWSESPAAGGPAAQQAPQQPSQPQPPSPSQAPAHGHVPGTHEWDGRDSGSIDYSAVRTPHSGVTLPGTHPGSASPTPPRPLHLGPPVPEQSGAVRSLSDRGPGTPAPPPPAATHVNMNANAHAMNGTHAAHANPSEVAAQAAQGPPEAQPPGEPVAGTPPAGVPVQQAPAAQGPEYLDVAHQEPAPLPGPQLGALPPQGEVWGQHEQQVPAAETVAPEPAMPGPNLAEVPAPAPAPGPAEAYALAQAGAQAHAQGPPQPQGGHEERAYAPAEAPVASPAQQRTRGLAFVGAPGGAGALGQQPAEVPVPAQAVGPEAAVPGQEPVPGQESVPVPPQAAEAPEIAQPQPQPGPEAAVPPAVPGEGEPAGPGPEAEVPGVGEAPTGAIPVPPAEPPASGEQPGALISEDGTAGEAAPSPADTPSDEAVPGSGAEAEGAEGVQPAEQTDATPNAEAPAPAEPTEALAAAGAPGHGPEAEQPQPQPEASANTAHTESPEALPSVEPTESTAAAAPSDEPGVPDTPGHAAPPPPPQGEPAPGYDEAEREAVHRLMRERRDIRNGFRPDPIPHEVLLRVLEAAHTAPSVGHSQPWDFVVIRSEETRRAMHELAQRQREAYAKSLPKGRAKQFKELKIEAILDTPVNIVVTADPTRGGRHTLGRHTQPQMAPYSSALAVENLWLAARAEGLGVGWVSFFDEREMVRALDLPEHLEVVAYLCVGYVDEFPPEPELAQAGWSKRRPLSWVVHEESYGRRVLPGAEPHDLLAETIAAIRPLDAKALGEAWERQKRMTKPAGALGMLEIISAQLCGLSRQCPPPVPEPAAVAVFAGDHGVHAQGVTPWPQEVTAQMVANFLGGGAVCNAFANQVGAEVCVVDVGVAGELPATPGLLPRKVRAGTADMTVGPALTREETQRGIEVGIETARDLVAAGNKALLTGEMGIANTTASAALIAACTGNDPVEVTGRGTGINDETHARKVDVVRRALELHQPDPADPLGLLCAFGGLEHAAIVGLILGGASLRTPVLLDGVSAGAAALVARRLAPEALAACVAGHRSAEPGHVAALTKLGLRPLVDLDMRLGEGTGALLALPMVQSAARAMHEVATFDSAGVTEKT